VKCPSGPTEVKHAAHASPCKIHNAQCTKATRNAQTQSTMHKAQRQCTKHKAQSTTHNAQSTKYRAQCTKHKVQSTMHKAQRQRTIHKVQSTMHIDNLNKTKDFPLQTATIYIFVSLSMKFQASRFSASGRKMPLEPHRSEACRSCQPMHVLSFGEGRKCFLLGPSRISATSVWCMKRCARWIFGMSCDHGYTLRQRGRQCPRFCRWRFDDCVFFVLYHATAEIRFTAS